MTQSENSFMIETGSIHHSHLLLAWITILLLSILHHFIPNQSNEQMIQGTELQKIVLNTLGSMG